MRLFLEEDGHAPFQLPLAGTKNKARRLRADMGNAGEDPVKDKTRMDGQRTEPGPIQNARSVRAH